MRVCFNDHALTYHMNDIRLRQAPLVHALDSMATEDDLTTIHALAFLSRAIQGVSFYHRPPSTPRATPLLPASYHPRPGGTETPPPGMFASPAVVADNRHERMGKRGYAPDTAGSRVLERK